MLTRTRTTPCCVVTPPYHHRTHTYTNWADQLDTYPNEAVTLIWSPCLPWPRRSRRQQRVAPSAQPARGAGAYGHRQRGPACARAGPWTRRGARQQPMGPLRQSHWRTPLSWVLACLLRSQPAAARSTCQPTCVPASTLLQNNPGDLVFGKAAAFSCMHACMQRLSSLAGLSAQQASCCRSLCLASRCSAAFDAACCWCRGLQLRTPCPAKA